MEGLEKAFNDLTKSRRQEERYGGGCMGTAIECILAELDSIFKYASAMDDPCDPDEIVAGQVSALRERLRGMVQGEGK